MIFLSYAKEDAPKAERIYHLLNRLERPVFFDRKSLLPGTEWRVEIEENLNASQFLLFFCTPNSVTKEGFIQKELRMALTRAETMPEGRIFIIPLRFGDVTLPRSLEKYQWLDINSESDYDRLGYYIDVLWSKTFNSGPPETKEIPLDPAILHEDVVILLQGLNVLGTPVHSYLQLKLYRLQDLKNSLDLGENFKPEDFGTVIAAGQGEVPADLKAKMAREYNLTDLPSAGLTGQDEENFRLGFTETLRAILGDYSTIPPVDLPSSIPFGSNALREGIREGMKLVGVSIKGRRE